MNNSKPYDLAASPARQVEDIRVAPYCCLFPLTPALSLEAAGNPSPRGEQSGRVGFPLRGARRSLSLRERVRVRGNGANDRFACGIITGTVELDESSGEAGRFPNWQ
jgi:hypothetical protein